MKTQAFIIAFVISLSSNFLIAQNNDIRNTKWGADTAQVKKSETAKQVFSKKNNMVFTEKTGDMDTRIMYDFNAANQLIHVAYLITLDNKDPQAYVNNYVMLEEVLTKKYGTPYIKNTTTINGIVIKQDDWASNLLSDNLYLNIKWKNDKTDISLALFNVNDMLHIEINYNSIELIKKDSEDKKKQLFNKL